MTDSYTVESAVAALDAADEPQAEDTQPAAVAEEQAEPADDSPADEAEASEGEADEPASEDEEQPEADEPAKPAIDPPEFWSADAKARFSELPDDLKQVVLEQERNGVTARSKALQEAAEARNKADAEYQTISNAAQALQQFVPQAVETFKSRWENIDWVAWANQDPDAAFRGKLQFEAEQQQLQQLQAAKQQADTVQQKRIVEAEREQLKTLAPQLADPKDGPKRQQELASFLSTQGFEPGEINQISARAAAVAWKAMQYDQAQASLKTNTPPRKAAPKTAKPSAVPPGNSQQRSAQAQQNRFRQTKSIDDAVALLNLRE